MMLGSDLDIAGGRAAAVTNLSQQLEEGPKPTVAAIEGVCLGAGLELALACSARVAVRTAVLAGTTTELSEALRELASKPLAEYPVENTDSVTDSTEEKKKPTA